MDFQDIYTTLSTEFVDNVAIIKSVDKYKKLLFINILRETRINLIQIA
jgi:hypothetical protein